MPDILLRSARESDEKWIKDLIHRVRINPFNLHWEHFIVAETPQGELIGCGQLKPHQDGCVEMASLAVEEAYREQGVGRRIIALLILQAPRPLYLMCRPGLGEYYAKFGFQTIQHQDFPPYFSRMRRMIQIFTILARHAEPLIMRLDNP